MVKAEYESSATEPRYPDDQLSGELASLSGPDDLSRPDDLSGPDDELIPAIPASAGALIFDRKGRLLILKPTYKTGWTIPGGVMEADGESPWEACKREVREESGVTVRTGRLACVDFRRPRPGRPGGIRYLFDCGRLEDAALRVIELQPDEISEYRFVKPRKALTLLRGPIRRRVRAACAARHAVYLEDGRPVPEVAAR
jgi:ADP-ribose pyrophosphatase YjhB (NUDIX family)